MIIVMVIGTVILGIITMFTFNNSIEKNDDIDLIIESDVIMPSKVSRPGCEEDDRCYIPSQIVIEPGKQVTWVNEDSAFHSVTSGFYGEPTELFDSGHLDPYQSFSFTFDEIGIYDYYCTLHPWMDGQVIVE
jgi:plastocyanin